jgi:transposase
MFYAVTAESGERHGVVQRVAAALGISPTAVRHWVHDADLASGRRQPGSPGATATAASGAAENRIRELEREKLELERDNRELRRANEILKSASAFFAAELDRRSDS